MSRIVFSFVLMLSVCPAVARAAHSLDAEPALSPVGEISALTTGDVNGDGIDDVVVGTTDGEPALWVFGRSATGLATPRRIPFPTAFPRLLSTADFNGNGLDEILVVDNARRVFHVSVGPSSRVTIARIADAQATNADIGDFDSDGHVDVFLADPIAGGWILFGDGRGAFPRRTPIGLRAFSVAQTATGDLDGDGTTDYVLVSDAAYVYLNRGDGTFSLPTIIQPSFERGISSVAVGDFSGDGLDDLVLAHGRNSPTTIKTYWQVAGQLAYAGETSTRDLPTHTAVGDLDGDGGDDLAVVHNGWGRIGVYMSTSPGSLPPEQLYTLPWVSFDDDVRISDVTGDGCKDLVASRGNEVALFRGHGCGLTSDLRLTGALSGHGIHIVADNLGSAAPLQLVVVDATVSTRSGLLSVTSIPAGCHAVGITTRATKLRCELDAIAASSSASWSMSYAIAGATAHNRVTLSATSHTATQERTLENNQLWRAWMGDANTETEAKRARPR